MRRFKFLCFLVLFTVAAATLGPSLHNHPTKAEERHSYAAPFIPEGGTLSGGYLAGRFAQHRQDWDAAKSYMSIALKHDQDNDLLTQRTFLLTLGSGGFAEAKRLALKIAATREGTELAVVFLACDAIKREDFKAALLYLDRLPTEGFGQYTKPLLTAWTLMGMGKKDEAKKLLAENMTVDDPSFHIHAGLMNELAGDMTAAAGHYAVAMKEGLDLHTAVLVGNFYQRYGHPEITRGIYQGLDKAYPFNPFISALSSADVKRPASPNITHAAEGASMVLFELATLLYEKRAYDSAQIYDSMVQMMNPKSSFAKMMQGDIAALYNRYDKALAIYGSIAKDDPAYWLSRMRTAEIYEADAQLDKSIQMLTDLSENPSTRIQALSTLGDIYRRHEQFGEAIAAYDRALASVATITSEHWPIIYARGISRERMKDWGLAEKDLLQALSFQPENPMILNFIAYGWANQGVHLDKALEYARQAAALRPDDGYILDSYGWTLFQMTRYEESIKLLENAVAQLPNDSTLLDHLGDAYWQVGRHNEARHQWRQAHDLSHDTSFKSVVSEKMKNGIVVPSQVARKEAKL